MIVAWLLANWRLVAVLALIAALGIQTYRVRDIQADFDKFELEVAAAGAIAKERAEAINAHNELIREEMEHDIAIARMDRDRQIKASAARFDSLYGKYLGMLNDPGRGRVPEANPRSDQPVLKSVDGGRAGRIATALERPLRELHQGTSEDLAGSGVDDLYFWGRWARLVDACPKP